MGQKHASNLAACPDVRVVGVHSLPRAGAVALAAAHGSAVFDDLDGLIEASDAIVIALPPGAHQGQVERIVTAGRHVFVEKPIALRAAAAWAMVAAVEASGVVGQVGFHYRFMSPVARLRALVESGDLGTSGVFTAAYRCRALHAPWWRDVQQSGGQLLEQAIHMVDLAQHLFGPVAQVGAVTANRLHRDLPDYTVEDVSTTWFQFANGALGSLVATNTAVPTEWAGTASGTFDRAVWELLPNGDGRYWDTRGQDAETWFSAGETPTAQEWPAGVDPYVAEITHWIECIRHGTPSRAPLRDGATAVAIAEAALESSRQGGASVKISVQP